jgi:citrate lyase alpha subunit
MKTFSYLHDGFVYRLGSGDVSLRYDRWLEEGLLAELILVVHISDIDLRVN